jgi:Integrase core domain
VVIDIFSRYVPGWLLATRESAKHAERFLAETIRKQHIVPDQLTIHSDRGTSMASKTVALLLADLGVIKSHSRPHCSNDNPYSEAQFKTLKYRPEFPDQFGSIEDGRAFVSVSSAGTTTNTAIRGWGSTRPPASTLGRPHPSNSSASACCTPPTPPILNASCANFHCRHPYQDPPGSTNLRTFHPHSNLSRRPVSPGLTGSEVQDWCIVPVPRALLRMASSAPPTSGDELLARAVALESRGREVSDYNREDAGALVAAILIVDPRSGNCLEFDAAPDHVRLGREAHVFHGLALKVRKISFQSTGGVNINVTRFGSFTWTKLHSPLL